MMKYQRAVVAAAADTAGGVSVASLTVAALDGFHFPADIAAATGRDQQLRLVLVNDAPEVGRGLLEIDLQVEIF